MATQVRHPIWLPAASGTPGARTFAILYAVESFARAFVASVIPIQAYDILKSEQGVSVAYTLVAFLGLFVTLAMPALIDRFARRRVYTMGIVALAVASVCLVGETLAGQLIGMLLRVIGASALAVTLNLYIMDHIRKTEFMRSESLRMAWSTIAWTAGPTLGVVLYTQFGPLVSHGVVVGFALLLLALFWYFRLGKDPAIQPGRLKPAGVVANIGRFWSQPRLRLAWLIAFGRSCFWTSFFIYVPVLMVSTGQGSLAGGLVVSAGNAMLFSAILWGAAGMRYGARRVITLCFVFIAVGLAGAALAGVHYPLAAAGMLLFATIFGVGLDALGSTAFLRSVRFHERARMTAVYRTYLDLSELLPPLVFSIVLAFTGLGGAFAALGVFMAVCAVISWRFLPKSL